MTLLTVSNQGFTVHNHICGINFLSHLRGAPQESTPKWDELGWRIAQTHAKLGWAGMRWDDRGGGGNVKIG